MHGVPSGDHAPFLAANIPAFTIRFATADISPKYRQSLAVVSLKSASEMKTNH